MMSRHDFLGVALACSGSDCGRGGVWTADCTLGQSASRKGSGRVKTATRRRACSPSPGPTRCGPRSRRPAGRRRSRCSAPTTCATGASHCCTCAGCRGRGSGSRSGSGTWRSPRTSIRMCSPTSTNSTTPSCWRPDGESGHGRARVVPPPVPPSAAERCRLAGSFRPCLAHFRPARQLERTWLREARLARRAV
jgi:hypothetical protein